MYFIQSMGKSQFKSYLKKKAIFILYLLFEYKCLKILYTYIKYGQARL